MKQERNNFGIVQTKFMFRMIKQTIIQCWIVFVLLDTNSSLLSFVSFSSKVLSVDAALERRSNEKQPSYQLQLQKQQRQQKQRQRQRLQQQQRQRQRQQQQQPQKQQQQQQNSLQHVRELQDTNGLRSSKNNELLVAGTTTGGVSDTDDENNNDHVDDRHDDDYLTSKRARIVGGNIDLDRQYPWYGVSADLDLCGSTLIHPDIMLTAAHCKGAFASMGVGIGGVRVDGHDKKAYRLVTGEYQHHLYDDANDLNDIMLVKLFEPVTDIQPVVLNYDVNVPLPTGGEKVTIIGFGFTAENNTHPVPVSYSDYLKEANIYNVDFETCNALYQRIDNDSMICAGVEDGSRDSCVGDSGGPLLTQPDLEQVGIIAFGIGCGRPNTPGVYVRVSHYKDWIQDGICQLSSQPLDSTICHSVMGNFHLQNTTTPLRSSSSGTSTKITEDSPNLSNVESPTSRTESVIEPPPKKGPYSVFIRLRAYHQWTRAVICAISPTPDCDSKTSPNSLRTPSQSPGPHNVPTELFVTNTRKSPEPTASPRKVGYAKIDTSPYSTPAPTLPQLTPSPERIGIAKIDNSYTSSSDIPNSSPVPVPNSKDDAQAPSPQFIVGVTYKDQSASTSSSLSSAPTSLSDFEYLSSMPTNHYYEEDSRGKLSKVVWVDGKTKTKTNPRSRGRQRSAPSKLGNMKKGMMKMSKGNKKELSLNYEINKPMARMMRSMQTFSVKFERLFTAPNATTRNDTMG